MNTYLFTQLNTITPYNYRHHLLPQLPEWRKQQAERYRFFSDKVLSAKSFIMLKEALLADYGIDGDIRFRYSKNGKPYLVSHPDVHFNISHCTNGIICAISKKCPVGCDIEDIVPQIDDNLLNGCFNSKERQTIIKAPSPQLEFTMLWTRKEALLKLTGEGLQNDMVNILDSPLAHSLAIESHVLPIENLVYSICHGTSIKEES